MHQQLIETHDQFVEKMGFLSTLLGFSKIVGQIYGVLYLSPKALSLNELMDALRVSKGSVSVNIRILEKWGGCRKVWVKGDRRDYYSAEIELKHIINKRLVDAIKRRVLAFDDITQSLQDGKNALNTLTEGEKDLLSFYKERIKRINKIRGKIDLVFNTLIRFF
ncbi:MAG: hypothetical protein Q8Q33_01145 [Chlamydiota bacterium]|nr:hypothetical protein [Chlamydiota bacterium]